MTELPEIEALKPPVGSYVAVVFRVDGYDADVGETSETATMARLTNVGFDGEETGWKANCIGLYNSCTVVVGNPNDLLTPAPSDPGAVT